jgi:hypothetical protein
VLAAFDPSADQQAAALEDDVVPGAVALAARVGRA